MPDDVKWAYKTIYRKGLSFKRVIDQLRTRGDRPIVAEMLTFIGSSERGIVPGRGDPRRGTCSP